MRPSRCLRFYPTVRVATFAGVLIAVSTFTLGVAAQEAVLDAIPLAPAIQVNPPVAKPAADEPAAVKPAAVKPAAVKPAAVKPAAVRAKPKAAALQEAPLQDAPLRNAPLKKDDKSLIKRRDAALEPNQPMNSFIDGEYVTMDVNGNRNVVRQDVMNQLRHYSQFKFCRVFAGDTLEKIAFRHRIRPDVIRLLNQFEGGDVFGEESLICLKWTEKVSEGGTLAELAKKRNTPVQALVELNHLDEKAVVKTGQTLQFPAVYRRQRYEDANQKMTMFMVMMPQNRAAQRQVLDFERIEMEQYQVKKEDTLESLAKAHDTDVETLRKINGLNEKSKLKVEQILFLRCRVKFHPKKTPLNMVASRFVTTEQSILKLNDIKDKSKIKEDQYVDIPAANMVKQMNARIEQRKRAQAGGAPRRGTGF